MNDPNVIERPADGTIIRGMERVRISCRKKISESEKIRQTKEHHAFSYVARENVIIKVEKSYYQGDGKARINYTSPGMRRTMLAIQERDARFDLAPDPVIKNVYAPVPGGMGLSRALPPPSCSCSACRPGTG